MSLNFGLTDTGFIAPTYEEVLDSVEDDMQEKFGNDIALTSNSNFGILARMIAWRETLMIQELQSVYFSGFISEASGEALDRLANNIGLTRKVATPATGQITVTTDGEYLIEADEQFETEGGIVFDLIGDIVTTQQPDGTWQATGDVQADESGALGNVMANTITVVSNPDDNVLAVTNTEATEGGQDDETDEDFRERVLAESNSVASATINGLETALLSVSGVREVKVDVEPNVTNTASDLVYIYVLGGEKQAIAEAIASHVALGAQLRGNETVTIIDETGTKRDYSFSYATSVPIYAKVTITTGSAWNTTDGVDMIKQAIADSINSLKMGNTVRYTRLYSAIYEVDGVEDAEVTIGKSTDSLASADIVTSSRESPTCSIENVEVVISGS